MRINDKDSHEFEKKSRIQELGSGRKSILYHEFFDKSKTKIDKMVQCGYQVRDEVSWIETDIEKNYEIYEAENRIDKWLKQTDKEARNEVFFDVARQIIGFEDISVFIDDYKIKGIRSGKLFTMNPVETVEMANLIIIYCNKQ